LPFTTSGQEMERVYSFNPRTGRGNYHLKNLDNTKTHDLVRIQLSPHPQSRPRSASFANTNHVLLVPKPIFTIGFCCFCLAGLVIHRLLHVMACPPKVPQDNLCGLLKQDFYTVRMPFLSSNHQCQCIEQVSTQRHSFNGHLPVQPW